MWGKMEPGGKCKNSTERTITVKPKGGICGLIQGGGVAKPEVRGQVDTRMKQWVKSNV